MFFLHIYLYVNLRPLTFCGCDVSNFERVRLSPFARRKQKKDIVSSSYFQIIYDNRFNYYPRLNPKLPIVVIPSFKTEDIFTERTHQLHIYAALYTRCTPPPHTKKILPNNTICVCGAASNIHIAHFTFPKKKNRKKNHLFTLHRSAFGCAVHTRM